MLIDQQSTSEGVRGGVDGEKVCAIQSLSLFAGDDPVGAIVNSLSVLFCRASGTKHRERCD
jgi:hypothetical protein